MRLQEAFPDIYAVAAGSSEMARKAAAYAACRKLVVRLPEAESYLSEQCDSAVARQMAELSDRLNEKFYRSYETQQQDSPQALLWKSQAVIASAVSCAMTEGQALEALYEALRAAEDLSQVSSVKVAILTALRER